MTDLEIDAARRVLALEKCISDLLAIFDSLPRPAREIIRSAVNRVIGMRDRRLAEIDEAEPTARITPTSGARAEA